MCDGRQIKTGGVYPTPGAAGATGNAAEVIAECSAQVSGLWCAHSAIDVHSQRIHTLQLPGERWEEAMVMHTVTIAELLRT